MKLKLIVVLMFISTLIFSQTTKKINIGEFGELNAVQNGDVYSIEIADFGTFDFKGSINPISLEAEVVIDQLKKVPGYDILKNLGLQGISFVLSSDGLIIKASADTEKNLKNICTFLKISSPTVEIEAKITKTSFALNGELAFSKEAIKIFEIEATGAKLSYYSAGLGAEFEPGSVEISVSTTLLVKPTEFDPELEVNYTFSYNLVTQVITGSGSMMSRWVDPFGMDQFFEENSVIIENAAVKLGINTVTLVPVDIGFAIDTAKFFDLNFGIALSVAPLDREFAIWATRNDKMTMNDVSAILRNNFGLKVPDIFPKDYYLDSVEIKFAPKDASIDEIEIPKGFKFAGAGKFKELTGYFDFDFDLQNEFSYVMDFEGDYKKFIMNEAHKLPKNISQVIEQVLTEIQIQRIFIELNAQKSDLSLEGEMKCIYEYHGVLDSLSFEASLDAEEIAKNLIDKLIKKHLGPITEIAGKAVKAGEDAFAIAKEASAITMDIMADAKTVAKHATYSKEECDTKYVPEYAYELSRHINDGSYDAVRKFYFEVIPELGKIKGATPDETRTIRSSLIKEDWDKIFVDIDADWKKVIDDRTYVRFYFLPESAKNGGNIYRDKVRDYRDKDWDYRKKVWDKMMTKTSSGNERANLKGTEIPKGTYFIQSVKAGNTSNGYLEFPGKNPEWKKKGNKMGIWSKDSNPNKQFYFHRNKYLSYYIITPASDKKYAMDCEGRGRNKRTALHLWKTHKGASQQFYFEHKGDGKFAIVPKSNHKMCIALVENKNADKGNKVHLWTYSDASSKQWYLINVKTGKKYIP